MTDPPSLMYGCAARTRPTSEYALMSRASAKPSRDVFTNRPSSSSRLAKARAWTRMSSLPCCLPHLSKTRAMSSSDWTSHGSTKVEPIDSASGLTRFSISCSTDEKPISAPSACSDCAMPHAIEWSLATPKISARRPSSSPISTSAVYCDRPTVQVYVLLRRTVPLPIDGHAVLLDGRPPTAVLHRPHGAPAGLGQRPAVGGSEHEAVAALFVAVGVDHRVQEAARGSHHGHRSVAHGDHLA